MNAAKATKSTEPSLFSRFLDFTSDNKETIITVLHLTADLVEGNTKAAFVKSLKLGLQHAPSTTVMNLQKSIEEYATLQKVLYGTKKHYADLTKIVLDLALSTLDNTLKCELIYDILFAEFGNFANTMNRA